MAYRGDTSTYRSVDVFYTNDIEKLGVAASEPTDPVAGAWAMFKKLRSYGLANDQIQIILRKFLLNQSVRQVMEEMGWTSWQTYYRRYRHALSVLKNRGYGSEKK